MKIRIIIWFALVCALLTSCIYAGVERVGVGYLQCENGVCFVDVDDFRYNCTGIFVLTNKDTGRHFQRPLSPTDVWSSVTVFRMNGNPKAEFALGYCSQEQLDAAFSREPTSLAALPPLVLFIIVTLIAVFGDFGEEPRVAEGKENA